MDNAPEQNLIEKIAEKLDELVALESSEKEVPHALLYMGFVIDLFQKSIV